MAASILPPQSWTENPLYSSLYVSLATDHESRDLVEGIKAQLHVCVNVVTWILKSLIDIDFGGSQGKLNICLC